MHDADPEVTLPPPGDETAYDHDLGSEEAGEDTMDSVPAGLLGSGTIANDALRSGPVEAELVEPRSRATLNTVKFDSEELRSDSSDETMAIGTETQEDLTAKVKSSVRCLGDFELERKVGQGGMGEVWLARQISLDRPVAVKVLPRSLATQENFIERFQREAKAAASLVHPNVIQIYAYGIDEGTPYFAMEYVEGEDLQERMRRERLDWAEIVDVMIGVGSALSIAHEKGIIHRDIKPSNVMLDKTGLVKVMDFGLAKATSGGPDQHNLTSAGLIMGTPNYLSPEQGRGDPLDGRSDLYSLGIVLYELVTGSLPFRADTPAGLIFKHVYEPPPPPLDVNAKIPPFLVEMTLKLLEKDPDDRYAEAGEFLADLSEFIENYEYYTEERGERRPGSGYKGSGRNRDAKSTSKRRLSSSSERVARLSSSSERARRPTSDRRNAVTEPAGLDPTDQPAVAKRPSGRDERSTEKYTSSARQPVSRLPKKKSRARPLFLLLVLIGAGCLGYAYKYENEQFMEWAGKLGLITPEGVAPPPLTTHTTPDTKSVGFTYAGTWPTGATIKLDYPSGKIDLKKGIQGRYALGAYRLEFHRPGYEMVGWPVTLGRGPDGKGQLLNPDGVDVATLEPDWQALPELSDAYVKGRAALGEGDYREALSNLDAAGRLDQLYRPSEVAPTVAELRAQLKKHLEERGLESGRVNNLLVVSKLQAERKRWRAALENLESLPEVDRNEAWKAFIQTCQAKIAQGDTIAKTVNGALARGDFATTQEALTQLGALDPEHPQLNVLVARLTDAKAARLAALNVGVDDALTAAAARLEIYIEQFGTKDQEAERKLKEIQVMLSAARELAGEEAALRGVVAKKDWVQAARMAAELLKIDPDNATAKKVQAQAAKIQNERAIAQVIKRLDAALLKRGSDAVLRLFDPKSRSYKIERAAILNMRLIQGRFRASTHQKVSVVSMKRDQATVLATWKFSLEVLGERPNEFSAQHRITLRRSAGTWLLTELRVEGDVRVNR